jgi:hypothetical protein
MNKLKSFAVAAAVLATVALTPSSASAANWYTGSIAPGSSKTFYWNNANPLNTSYVVGLDPVGATASNQCQVEVTRNWYQQKPGGEREFWFTIKNIGSITCGANILLRKLPAANGTWSSGALNPGQSQTSKWNNALYERAYAIGFSPQGATSTTSCQFELTRTWSVMLFNATGPAEREVWFTYKNIGSIACSADIQVGYNDVTETLYHPGMALGSSRSSHWNNANPLDRAYVLDTSTGFTTAGNSCAMEATRGWYVQKINTNGTTEREFHYTVKNVGTLVCPANVLLGKADA